MVFHKIFTRQITKFIDFLSTECAQLNICCKVFSNSSKSGVLTAARILEGNLSGEMQVQLSDTGFSIVFISADHFQFKSLSFTGFLSSYGKVGGRVECTADPNSCPCEMKLTDLIT